MALTPGTRLGPYQIVTALGAGGMGEVYRARDPRLDRQVAIKLLPTALAADRHARERLRREAMAVAALDHPYICKLFEIGEDGDALFLVMEYIAGTTLHQRLLEGRMPLPDALRLAGEIAEALQEAHAGGFLHRDLKPANIMLTPQGHVKVMDFGLAKRVEVLSSPDTATREMGGGQLTVQGTIVGTPDYMSPEQVKGSALDVRSDLFSFGVMLAEMTSGRHPFRQPSTMETFSAVLREPPALGGDIPPSADASCCGVCWPRMSRSATRPSRTCAPICTRWLCRPVPSAGTTPVAARRPGGDGWPWARYDRSAHRSGGNSGSCVPESCARRARRSGDRARCHSIDCRPSARQLLGRSQPGLLRRRDDRRTDGRSGDDQPASRDLARLGDAVQRRPSAADA